MAVQSFCLWAPGLSQQLCGPDAALRPLAQWAQQLKRGRLQRRLIVLSRHRLFTVKRTLFGLRVCKALALLDLQSVAIVHDHGGAVQARLRSCAWLGG